MKNTLYYLVTVICLFLISSVSAAPVSDLKVSENKRWLVYKNTNAPFYYQGDTGWFLFALKQAKVTEYLNDRAAKGFNAIQLHITPHYYDDKNEYGQSPYIDNNAIQFNTAYWDHVVWCVKQITDKGMRPAIIVGHAVSQGYKIRPYAVGLTDTLKAYKNGWLIADRLKAYNDKIIWVGGWDHNLAKSNDKHLIKAQMEGIADCINGVSITKFNGTADYSTTMMTLHPCGGYSSSAWVHDAAFLDFNWIQTYGYLDQAITFVQTDLKKTPAKPTMLCEGAYEGTYYQEGDDPYLMTKKRYQHHDGVWYSDEFSRKKGYDPPGIQPWHARYQAWQTVFAGACGNGYGHRGMIQTINYDWSRTNAAQAAGAADMKYLRQLMASHDMLKLSPAQSMIISGNDNTEEACVRAMLAADGSYAYLYSTGGESFKADLSAVDAKESVKAQWFNPRTGTYTDAGVHAKTGKTFDPPGSPGVDNDWVLVLTAYAAQTGLNTVPAVQPVLHQGTAGDIPGVLFNLDGRRVDWTTTGFCMLVDENGMARKMVLLK